MLQPDEIARLLPRTFAGMATQQAFFAMLLLLRIVGAISFSQAWYDMIVIWVAFNAFSLPLLQRRAFVKPKVPNPVCNFCGSIMSTIELACPSCGAVSKLPPEKKEKTQATLED